MVRALAERLSRAAQAATDLRNGRNGRLELLERSLRGRRRQLPIDRLDCRLRHLAVAVLPKQRRAHPGRSEA